MNNLSSSIPTSGWPRTLVAFLAFSGILGATVYRTASVYHVPVPKDTTNFGLCDFHNAVYFPGLAFSRGENPYSMAYADRYPVNRELPPYSPALLPLCVPFSVLPLRVAEVAWFTFNVIITLVFSWFLLREFGRGTTLAGVLGLSAFLIASRAGHCNLIFGQFAIYFAMATILTLKYSRTAPWRSGFTLALATIKPTFGIPLVVLMLCQRRLRAVFIGIAIGGIWALASIGWLALNQNSDFVASIQRSSDAHVSDEEAAADEAWMRTDLLSMVSRITDFQPGSATELAAMLLMLIPPGLVLWLSANQRNGGEAWMGVGDAIILATIPLCTYHLVYDSLVVMPVVTVLFFGIRGAGKSKSETWSSIPRLARYVLFAALLLPVVSYLPTWSFIGRFEIRGPLRTFVLSMNAMSLLLANVLLWRAALAAANTSDRSE